MTIEAYQSQQEPREQTVSVYPPKDVERDSATLENMVREFFFSLKNIHPNIQEAQCLSTGINHYSSSSWHVRESLDNCSDTEEGRWAVQEKRLVWSRFLSRAAGS